MGKVSGVSPELPEATAPGQSTNRVDGDKEAIISAGRGQRDRVSETMKGGETGRNRVEMEHTGLKNRRREQREKQKELV